ncbi:MAG: hypothetical protein IPF77_13270 [Gemmatimonadetes bacterium]|nr:hypothetical protein [Gemmatimonadota bacterium]
MPRSPALSPALIHQALDGAELAREVEFEHAGEALGGDLEAALGLALGRGAVHPAGREPLEVFRAGLASAIGRLAQSERAALFIRFLRDGPYPGPGRWLKAEAGSATGSGDRGSYPVRIRADHPRVPDANQPGGKPQDAMEARC